MTRDECVDLILRRLRRVAGDSDLVADVIREITLAQTNTLEKGPTKPWFLLTQGAVTVDGTGFKATLPTNFLQLYEEEGSVILVETDGRSPLEKVDAPAMALPLKPVGTVSTFDVDTSYVQFGTELDVAASVVLIYYKTDTVLDGDYAGADGTETNLWLTHAADVIAAEVCRVMAAFHLHFDDTQQQRFEAEAMLTRRRLLSETVARLESARSRLMNGGPYPVIGAVRT